MEHYGCQAPLHICLLLLLLLSVAQSHIQDGTGKGHSFLYNMQLNHVIMHIAPNQHVLDYSTKNSAEQL